MLAFLLGAFTIVGFEAAANLAEETQDAHRVVPTAMWFSVLLSGIVGFAFLVALNLASGNIAALTASATPVADIVTGTLGNVVGKVFLVLVTFFIFRDGSFTTPWIHSLVMFGLCSARKALYPAELLLPGGDRS